MRSILALLVLASALTACAPEAEAPRTWSMDDGAIFPAARGLVRAEDGLALADGRLIVIDQTHGLRLIAADGMMITSSKMLYPPSPVDLSDREHFKVHRDSSEDRLFISKPLLGRASNQWSVQFTRRLAAADGAFAGVVVISLDPSYLTDAYADVDLGRSGGLALIGDDGIVRAEGGVYRGMLGRPLPAAHAELGEKVGDGEAAIRFEEQDGRMRVAVVRDIEGFPLKAVIARSDLMAEAVWRRNRWNYLLGAIGLTFAVLVVIALLSVVLNLAVEMIQARTERWRIIST